MAAMTASDRDGESVLSPDWRHERDRLAAMAEVADSTIVQTLQDLIAVPVGASE
jgi:hypothetical protein